MPDTPLNPDALEVGAQSMECQCSKHVIDCGEYYADCPRHGHYPKAVSAYLAVAQPVVSSVEELEALPVGSAITTFADGRCTIVAMKVSDKQWASTGSQRVWTVEDVHGGLKGQTATVLYRPGVKP